MAVLLNDERLMRMTNMIGDKLTDPWACEGIPRTMFKHAATPLLYGSSQPCHVTWKDWGHLFTIEQVKLFDAELSKGALGVANAFKDFIINNVNPTELMKVNINGKLFDIECNRFKQVGTTFKQYQLYDTTEKRSIGFKHMSTKSVADLEQFRRYFVTLLIHHLDSVVMENIMQKYMKKYPFMPITDIYDAVVCNPETAVDIRKWYCEEMESLWKNRNQILQDYFQSIGINGSAINEWHRLQGLIHQYEGDFKCRRMALK